MSFDFSKVLNSHKNKLLNVTRTLNFSLSLLEITEEPFTFIIAVRDTPLKFVIKQSGNDFLTLDYDYYQFKPDFPKVTASQWTDIDRVCIVYKDWLTNHAAKYLELANVPDQWAEARLIQPLISSRSFSQEDFEMFTENEKKQIQDSLNEFQRLVKEELDPMKESLDLLQEKIDYLNASVNRLNRFDWKGIALSTVMGIATNLSVDTNTGKQVFDLFRQAFNSAMLLLPK